MSLFENVKCPVCNRFFEDGDDIVVCPDCGTPHHRECYSYAGKCVNSGLHKTDFVFDRGNKSASQSEKPQEEKAPIGAFFPIGGVKNERDGADDKNAVPPMPFGAIPELTDEIANDNETIDGESVGDVAAAVRNNVPRFVKLFKKYDSENKKIGWNWCAFFFGSLYYFYRKMYKYAVSLIALSATLFIALDFVLSKLAPDTMKIVQEAANLASQNKVNEANAALANMQSASDFGKVMTITYAFFGALLVIRILEAMLADRLYKDSVISLVKYVRTQLADGATFTTPLSGVNDARLSQEQMKRYYLASKGGVSIFAPVAAFLAVDFLLSII